MVKWKKFTGGDFFMKRKKHKKKVNHIVIFTTDAVDAKVRQWRIRPFAGAALTVLFCIVIGIIAGVLLYEEEMWSRVQETVSRKEEVIGQHKEEIERREEDIQVLQDEKEALNDEIEALNEKIAVLSETVNQKVKDVEVLQGKIDAQSIPTGFPLTGSATMTESASEIPLCTFTGMKDTLVVAAANGVVLSIEEDIEFGFKITVDHGNGYYTIYRNNGEALVKQGDTIFRGSALFIIDEQNLQLGYQMIKDGIYVNPMDVISVSG